MPSRRRIGRKKDKAIISKAEITSTGLRGKKGIDLKIDITLKENEKTSQGGTEA